MLPSIRLLHSKIQRRASLQRTYCGHRSLDNLHDKVANLAITLVVNPAAMASANPYQHAYDQPSGSNDDHDLIDPDNGIPNLLFILSVTILTFI